MEVKISHPHPLTAIALTTWAAPNMPRSHRTQTTQRTHRRPTVYVHTPYSPDVQLYHVENSRPIEPELRQPEGQAVLHHGASQYSSGNPCRPEGDESIPQAGEGTFAPSYTSL